MDAESFTDLAFRVLAREASADECRVLEQELAANPSRREEFDELKATYEVLTTAAPMSAAVAAREPELPAWRCNELRTAVRQHFGPAASREKAPRPFGVLSAVRWLFVGGGFAACGVAIVLLCFANTMVEVGLYQGSLERSDINVLTAADVPAAKIVAFDQDAPFDQWQDQPLAWYQHAKVWVDNEHDLLHIVVRKRHGQILIMTQPLAPTVEGQREQIKQVVDGLKD